jgi:hypothetical protein
MKTLSSCLAAAAAVAALGAAVPARADSTPISIQIGPQFPLQTNGRNAGGDVQSDVGLNYDFGPKTIVPIRASFQFDYAGGTHTDGNLNAYGFGIAGRLTTPLYAGAGISVYEVNARQAYAGAPSYSWAGVGTNIFVGDTIFQLPGGAGVSIQGTYKVLPVSQGIDPSSFGVDFRLQL